MPSFFSIYHCWCKTNNSGECGFALLYRWTRKSRFHSLKLWPLTRCYLILDRQSRNRSRARFKVTFKVAHKVRCDSRCRVSLGSRLRCRGTVTSKISHRVCSPYKVARSVEAPGVQKIHSTWLYVRCDSASIIDHATMPCRAMSMLMPSSPVRHHTLVFF